MALRKPGLRTQILQELRSASDPMPEEAIAASLGKSVDSVHKVCQSLLAGSHIRKKDIMSPCWKGCMAEGSDLNSGERAEMEDHRDHHTLGSGFAIND